MLDEVDLDASLIWRLYSSWQIHYIKMVLQWIAFEYALEWQIL
jgi:hypothetical protein